MVRKSRVGQMKNNPSTSYGARSQQSKGGCSGLLSCGKRKTQILKGNKPPSVAHVTADCPGVMSAHVTVSLAAYGAHCGDRSNVLRVWSKHRDAPAL